MVLRRVNPLLHRLDFYDQSVERYASRTPTHVSRRYVVDFAQGVREGRRDVRSFSRFLHRELPVRMGQTIRDFQVLPYIVCTNPHFQRAYHRYTDTFARLAEAPVPDTPEAHAAYCRLLERRLDEHAGDTTDFSKGLREVRLLPASARVDLALLDRFIDQLLADRVGRRVLMEFMLALNAEAEDGGARHADRLGVISMQCAPAEIAESSLRQVCDLAIAVHGVAPPIEVVGDIHTRLPYVASHLEWIICELGKNAVRATIEHHLGAGPLPPVVLRVCEGKDVTLVLKDRGGGLAPEALERAATCGFSTARPDSEDAQSFEVRFGERIGGPGRQPFAGYGFGLPLSRVLCKYAGGDIRLHSMAGFGMDLFLTMPRHITDTLESWERRGKQGDFDTAP
eukprot:TRINITY_DN14351_c0_g1_i2.p1 TRINITY_DN14351_c0_g1~~TRINITY_DN14351_c0_g1_i2.p1  ORF type:complete len:396 (+),score=86.46 TRINITY_DN14351_c0_g1_i2:98-1285(+)